jgi:hypothetical protein
MEFIIQDPFDPTAKKSKSSTASQSKKKKIPEKIKSL